jgi:hypothetical protein
MQESYRTEADALKALDRYRKLKRTARKDYDHWGSGKYIIEVT